MRKHWILSCCLAGFAIAAMTGCIDQSMLESHFASMKKTGEEEETPVAAPAPVPAPAAKAPIAPLQAREMVDKKAAMKENPKLIETTNRINASDPVSAAAQGFFAVGAQVHLLNLKHAVDLYKAEHERFPTFAEFDKMLKENTVQLKGLYRWQVYAYDDTDGTLSILEDPDMKAEMKAN